MPNIKNNLRAASRPAAADDASQGYAIGSEWFNRNDAGVWRCVDATTGAAKWIETNPDAFAWPSNHLRAPSWVTRTETGTVASDLLTMAPFTFARRYQVSGIGIRLITAQAGGEVRLGIYRTNPDDHAAVALVGETGVLPLDSGSGNKTATVDWDLVPGNYWLASVFKNATTMPSVQRAADGIFGAVTRPSADNVASAAIRYRSLAHIYGPLPSVPVAVAVAGGGDLPLVYLRRA